MTLQAGESLVLAMAALEELEKADINDVLPVGVTRLEVYRWRPREKPDLPALWHWPSTDSDSEAKDTAMREDRFRLSAYIGIEPAPADEIMGDFEVYADAFREVIDPAFNERNPLNGAAVTAERKNMRPVLDTFGVIDVLCIEFPLELRLTRILNP